MLNFGGKNIGEMYYGERKIGEAYLGDRLVYQSVQLPVEVLPDGTETMHARDWLRGKLAEYGEHYETVETLPFKIDTSQTTSIYSMFYDCSSLTKIPDMDTSNVTSMSYIYKNCSSLVTAPAMDTSQAVYMSGMFDGCSSLTFVPDMDASLTTDTRWLFRDCSQLTDGNVRLLRSTSRKPSRRTSMIENSGLTREPFFLFDGTPI